MVIGSSRFGEARAVAGLALPAVRALASAGALKALPPARALQALGAARTFGLGAAGGCAVSAARDPHGIAVIDERGSIGYAQLNERAERIAAGLRAEHGVGPDRALAVMCRNHRGFVEAMLTASRLGADLLLLNTDFPGPQLVQALAPHDPAAIVHDAEFGPALDAAGARGARVLAWHDEPDASPGPVATASTTLDALAALAAPKLPAPPTPGRLVILSSGTTGAPKGAARQPSASAVLGPLTSLLEQVKPRARDPIVIGPPVFHGFGLAFLGVALFIGAPVVLRRRFDPQWALEAIAAHRATHLVGVPLMLQRVLGLPAAERARHDLTSLRGVASAGAPLAPDVATAFMDAFGDLLFDLYGSTETGLASLAGPADLRAAPGTVGRPPRGTTLRVLGADRRPVAPGTVGTVFVGSGLVFDGYTGGGSREVVDGLMSIGDLGHLDADGRLFVDGREDDMILSGGENVFPQEVEDVLAGHPRLADAAVIGVEDPDFGQRLRAFVVPRDGEQVAEEELTAYLRERLARYKLPREIAFLGAIPRNPTGKVLRRELSDR
ncbi:MAG TPA: AMP-binding protein [Conexibacter sp.]|nr:AMP-binding protein [Conexibacter sp.]